MKKLMLMFLSVLLLSMTSTIEGNAKEKTSNMDVQTAVKKSLHTQVPILLPKKLPTIEKGFLSAKTSATQSTYRVVYYGLRTHEKVNSNTVMKAPKEKAILRVTGKKYKTTEQAARYIAARNEGQLQGNKVTLGSNVIGYQDAGAGSLWTSWKMGRWTLTTRTTTENGSDGLKIAKNTIAYLNKNWLPIPHKDGIVLLDYRQENSSILWQEGKVVYRIDLAKSANDLLQSATAMSTK